ncbi:MAG: exodeoxyribonuclease V subunit alpha [Deltaproteobacteria bacterium]|nr:MAG: exodeoxyribonuclease V subunit alpha [Deltaproteobacteria bacterium]
MKKETIDRFYENMTFSYLDIHFKNFTAKLVKKDVAEVSLAAVLVSHYKEQGHICVELSGDMEIPVSPSELENWRRKLERSPVVGKPGEYKPLILDGRSRLYLYRYWEYQEKLANLIRKWVVQDAKDIDFKLLEEGLERLFPANQTEETDWQKVAAFTALTQRFCVISGGPGTGKTTTVAKILALLLEQNSRQKIALAAPTGKAAARLQESILREKMKSVFDGIRDAIPEEASTLHRLLGSIPDSPYFHHNAKNRLSADIVVVDEASMVDMALMSKLVQAIAPDARLILLGDKDQLASVEAGAALGDICESECRGIVQLRESYRFRGDSGIGAVSLAVNLGNADHALSCMKDETHGDIRWKELPRRDDLVRGIRDTVIQGFKDYLQAIHDPLKIFQQFEQFRILCALRKGPYGAVAVNKAAERILMGKNLIKPDKTWYEGRPVMITRNDYHLRLFNGDVGITLPDPEAGNGLRVFFPDADGLPRKVHPLRLPEHETVYAMTVHKSQGSEFDNVLLLLPDRDSPVLTRELIYTGVTRAIHHVEIWGTESIFREAVSRRIQRTSGLRDALRGK